MTKTYRIVFSDNAGSRAVDAIATTVQGSWSNAVERFDGEHDLAFVEVPADNAEYLESILDDDSNVISYIQFMGCTLLPYRASGQQGLEPKMLTIAEYNADTHSFYARLLNADASSGEIVIPGQATDNEIREFANENLCAPQCGDFSSAPVEWESA